MVVNGGIQMAKIKKIMPTVSEATRIKNAGDDKTRVIFSTRLEQLLIDNNLTQQEFSKKIDSSTGAVSTYINALKCPSISTLQRISKEFNISADYLLGLTDTPTLDENIQMISKYTGLSQRTIEYLKKLKSGETTDKQLHTQLNIKKLYALNNIIVYDSKYDFLDLIGDYLYAVPVSRSDLVETIELSSRMSNNNKGTKSDYVQKTPINYIYDFGENDLLPIFDIISEREIYDSFLVRLNNNLTKLGEKIRNKNKDKIDKLLQQYIEKEYSKDDIEYMDKLLD